MCYLSIAKALLPLRCRYDIPSKQWYLPTNLHTYLPSKIYGITPYAKICIFYNFLYNEYCTNLLKKTLTAEKSFNFGISPSNLNVSAMAFIKSNLTSSFLSTAYFEKTQSMYLELK